ncbi:hypothetical protein [Bradyrhizobium sp. RDI18]|uniref:hypothetical protein n=1 Tax=Bradyrhizobium sp. RDI18 TaxID=3367400 RepID=UPI003722B0C8
MKEMVSWRGVAKKRREQEAGAPVNQMFPSCCSHATNVARRQPLFKVRGNPSKNSFRETKLSTDHNLRAIDEWKSDARIARRIQTDHWRVPQRRIGQRNPNDIHGALSSIAAIAHTESYTRAMPGVRKGSRHFCAPALFAPVFVTQ